MTTGFERFLLKGVDPLFQQSWRRAAPSPSGLPYAQRSLVRLDKGRVFTRGK